jgi:hypothetical protein
MQTKLITRRVALPIVDTIAIVAFGVNLWAKTDHKVDYPLIVFSTFRKVDKERILSAAIDNNFNKNQRVTAQRV